MLNCYELTILCCLLTILILDFIPNGSTFPILEATKNDSIPKKPKPRQVSYRTNPDGSITASIAAAESFRAPGATQSFAIDEAFTFGPRGFSMSGGQSFGSDILGNKMSFSGSNAQNAQFGPGGFSSSGSNAASNSFQNPFFSNSQAQANAFANSFRPGF